MGMQLIAHAANLMILTAGVGELRGEAFPDRADLDVAGDPLPQAFVLTAIVISMAITSILLTVAAVGRSDDTEVQDPVAMSGRRPVRSPLSTLGRSTRTTADERAHEEAVAEARAEETANWKSNKPAWELPPAGEPTDQTPKGDR